MQVSILSIIFMVISAVIQIGVPVYLFILFYKKFDAKIMPMVLGVIAFIVFALVLESSIHRVVLGKFALREKPALYIIYGIFMAGIFEETARFIFLNVLKRKKYKGIGTGLSYGIGHGGTESILIAGMAMVSSVVLSIMINTGSIEMITAKYQGDTLMALNTQLSALTDTPSYMFLVSGFERLMAICIQLSLSVVVFYAVFGKKILLFPLAILMHAVIDISPAAFQAGVIKSVFVVEGIIFIFALLIMLFAKYLHDKLKASLTEE